MKTCSVKGCENSNRSMGYCGLHYSRWRKYQDPLGFTPRTKKVAVDTKLVMEMYKTKSASDIAVMLGTTSHTILKRLREAGVTILKTRKGINVKSKNGSWKGDKVGLSALHGYMKRRLVKPVLCQGCNLRPVADLANISQMYKRDDSDWEWLCRTCHMDKDGRFRRFQEAHAKWLKSR